MLWQFADSTVYVAITALGRKKVYGPSEKEERSRSLGARRRLCGFPAVTKPMKRRTAGKFHSDSFQFYYLGVLISCF